MMGKKNNKRTERVGTTLPPNPVIIFMAIVGILLGVFMIFSQGENKPISREEAVSYSGVFESYEIDKNYRGIHFEDGSVYEVYPHTETQEFQDRMTSLKKGTVLHLMINPNNEYVIEIKTDTAELLNFEESQSEIDSYDNGYIGIGIFVCAACVFLIIFVIVSLKYKREENERQSKINRRRTNGLKDRAIRQADTSVKSRILLEATVEGYKICYRRVKSVNELVINGSVYDEKKGIIELAHKLSAVIDEHTIEAGLSEDDYSYIMFDGELIKEKQRII